MRTTGFGFRQSVRAKALFGDRVSVIADGRVLWIVLVLALLSVALLFGCGPVIKNPRPPEPPSTRTVALTLDPHVAHGTLTTDAGQRFDADSTDGRLVFSIPADATGGADLVLSADGFRTTTLRVVLAAELLEQPAALARAVQRVRASGRGFVTEDGQPWPWNGVTAFQLVEMVAHGREADADAFLAWCAANDVTVARVLTMAWNLFRLDADQGRAALPRLLDLAAKHGVHLEVVALADTASYSFDRRAHVAEIGAACAVSPACAAVELANEPIHPTQAPEVGDPAYLRDLAKLIPDNVLRALGPAGATIAESDTRFLDGSDYQPIHEERQDDGSGVRWVRHLNDLREISEKVGKPVVNDEPQRDDMSRDNHFGAGALTRIFGLGDTFHFKGGLQAAIPTDAELDGFTGRRAGWAAIPAAWTGGTYCNVGFAGCPATNADWSTVVKLYATVKDGDGYAVAVGVKGAPGVAWGNGWTPELLRADGRSVVWRVTR